MTHDNLTLRSGRTFVILRRVFVALFLAVLLGVGLWQLPPHIAAAAGDLEMGFAPVLTSNATSAEMVNALAVQSDGKILIGGQFNAINGVLRNNIARVNSDGTLDVAFANGLGGANGGVNAIALQSDGKILIGGSFRNVNGVARGGIARLNSDGTLDTAFGNGLAGIEGDFAVNAIAVQGDAKVIIGGTFISVNGTARRGIARLNSDGTLDTAFGQGITNFGVDGGVFAVVLQSDGKVIIGGGFPTVNDTARNNLARLNSDGTVDTGFLNGLAGSNDAVLALALQTNGKLIIGGAFTNVNGSTIEAIARLNADGTFDSSFDSLLSAGDVINAVVLQADGKLIIGGGLVSPGGFNSPQAGSNIARLNGDGTVDGSFGSGQAGANANVNAVALQSDGKVLIGGGFDTVNATNRIRLARLNSDGTLDTGFNPVLAAIGGAVALAVQADGKIVVGGSFTAINGTARNNIARLNAAGTLDTAFANGVAGTVGNINSVAVQPDGKVLIGGGFLTVNGVARNRIARLNADGTLDTGFLNGLAGANSTVNSAALQGDGKVLIGGQFSTVNGTARNNVARLNADGTLDTGFLNGLSGANASVLSVAAQTDGKVLLGGFFTAVNGTARFRIARLNSDGTVDAGFANGLTGANMSVSAIAVQGDGKVLLGGAFTNINSTARNRIARLNSDGTLDTAFLSSLAGADAPVVSIAAQSDGQVIIGGNFSNVNGVGRVRIARLNSDGALDAAFFNGVSGPNGDVRALALQSDGKVIVGGLFNSFNGLARSGVARLLGPSTDLVVTNTNDSGAGSLRQAITDSNNTAGVQTITFNIAGSGVQTIAPTSALPTISQPVIIDGYTQAGASRNTQAVGNNAVLLIEINGANAGVTAAGLRLTAGGSRVTGLVINRFASNNISLETAGGNQIDGNFIGTNPAGDTAQPGGTSNNGVNLAAGSNANTIGGASAGARNVISGNNQINLNIDSNNNTVQNNYLGPNAAGTGQFFVVNQRGLQMTGETNLIGGAMAALRNVIAGNSLPASGQQGVSLLGANGNTIRGNYIGVGADGATALPNGDGVVIQSVSADNIIGGLAAGEGNIIANSNQTGSAVRGHGVIINGATSVRNAILGNTIFNNAMQGIAHANSGNNNQAAPVLAAATSNGANTTVTGTLTAAANTTYRLEFFSNPVCDGASGEGQVLLGNTNVTTDGAGAASINITTLPNVAAGQVVTATATVQQAGATNNNTSQFSLCREVTASGGLTVTNTNDSGAGSLRQAITDSNNAAGAQTITFNIAGGGVQTIALVSSLPSITDPVIIDGYTQPGASPNSLAEGNNAVLNIEINGAGAGAGSAGLFITAGGSTVRGLVINRFTGSGIRVQTLGSNIITGNFIGTNAAGTAELGNGASGVLITTASPGNRIGGTAPAERNVISGNSSAGVTITNGGNGGAIVQGNYIGTDKNGNADFGNNTQGVASDFTSPGGHTIGGTTAGAGNLISGNNQGGISLDTDNCFVQGNRIGTNAAGVVALPNSNGSGIGIGSTASGHTIGGATAAARNVISGNAGDGIDIVGSDTNTVQGNFIGTQADGLNALGNTFSGIIVRGGSATNQIGGTAAGAGNVIAFNGRDGVQVSADAGTGNSIRANSIRANGTTNLHLGIDLGADSVTANDAGDADTGANNLQNFPVLTTASSNGSSTSVSGTLNSTANTTFRIEFFVNASCDPSGNGEGDGFQGFVNVTTDASGNANINATLPNIPVEQIVTATATNSTTNDTSEFSACRIVTAPASCVTLPANTVSWFRAENNANDQIGGNNGTLNNGATFAAGKVGQAFSLDGVDDFVIAPPSSSLNVGAGNGLTLEGWISPTTLNTQMPIFEWNRNVQNGFGIHFSANVTTATPLVPGALYANLVDTVGGFHQLDSGAVLVANTLQHVALTYDKTSGQAVIYRNGVAVATQNLGVFTPQTGGTYSLYLGSRPVADPGPNPANTKFAGLLDEMTVYGRALAAAEINGIFTADSAGKCVPPLMISGRLADSNNQALAGVAVALSGAVSGSALTDNSGNYSFANLASGGNYTVRPNSAAYVFTPARADFTNLTANQIQNFMAPAGVVPSTVPPLMDDFNGGGRDVEKWSLGILTQPPGSFDPNVTVSQATGQLVITPVANQTGLHYGGYVSVNNLDLSGGQMGVELVQAGTGGAQSLFSIGTDFNNFSRFMVVSPLPNQPLIIEQVINGVKQAPVEGTMPMLMFQLVQNGQVFLNIAIPYDPVAHRFLRFRHLARDANNNPANLLVFETSPDAAVYTERARGDLGERSVSAITVELAGGTAGLAGNPGPIIFDNLVTLVVNARFALSAVIVSEGAGAVTLNVTRSGLTNLASTMEYSTQDGTATQRTRYVAASGVLNFAAGETSKSLQVLLQDNALVDGSQDFNVFLGPGQGMGVNGPGRVVVTITDNDTPPITSNPLETPSFFVTQQYFDFLSRAPDQAGLTFWVGQIVNPCGGNAACISQRRVAVSNAFFFEQEFQQTGSYVYRLYRAAYGNTQPFPNTMGDMDANPYCTANPANCQLIRAAHMPSYAKFINDRARLDATQLAATQLALANTFSNRAEFRQRYPVTQTAAQFVDALIANIQAASGANLTAQRDALITLHGAGGRGAVLFRLAEDNMAGNPINNRAFIDAEYNRSFVTTQYYGYLRRDADLPGLNFWLSVVNQFPLRSPTGQNGMVCAFITSAEYQTRFSAIVIRTNAECGP